MLAKMWNKTNSLNCWWNYILGTATMENYLALSIKMWLRHLLQLCILVLGLYLYIYLYFLRKIKKYVHMCTKICTGIRADLSVTVRHWKQIKSINIRIDKLWHIHITWYHSARILNELQLHTTTWMNLKQYWAKETEHKRVYVLWFHLHKVQQQVKLYNTVRNQDSS